MASSRACVLAVETWLTTVKATGRCLVRFFSQAYCSDSEARSLCFHLELRCFLSFCVVSCKSSFQELDDLIGIILRSRLTEKYIKWSILISGKKARWLWNLFQPGLATLTSIAWFKALYLYMFLLNKVLACGPMAGGWRLCAWNWIFPHLCRLWKFDVLACWQSQLEDDWAHEQEF